MRERFKISGFKESHAVFQELPKRIQKNVLQQSISAGAREGAKVVKSYAPRHKRGQRSPSSQKYGTLKSNIRTTRLRRVKRGAKGARIHTGNAFWGLIIQLGSRFIPANPWFTRGFKSGINVIISTTARVMKEKIEPEAEKLARQKGVYRIK